MAIIPGTIPVTGTFAPTDTIDTFAIMDMTYILDGWRNVADKTERNAVTDERRKEGMIVGTQDTSEYWRLLPAPWTGTDTDWELFIGGDGASILSALDDVTLSSPIVDGNILVYNIGTGQWENNINIGDYLPLAGGTMSGTIISPAIEAMQITSGGYLTLDGATGNMGLGYSGAFFPMPALALYNYATNGAVALAASNPGDIILKIGTAAKVIVDETTVFIGNDDVTATANNNLSLASNDTATLATNNGLIRISSANDNIKFETQGTGTNADITIQCDSLDVSGTTSASIILPGTGDIGTPAAGYVLTAASAAGELRWTAPTSISGSTFGSTYFVAPAGNNTDAEVGNINKPWQTIRGAVDQAVIDALSTPLIYVFPGTYTDKSIQFEGGTFYFSPGAILTGGEQYHGTTGVVAVNQGTKTFTTPGNFATHFNVPGQKFKIWLSTANDGIYTIVSAVNAGGNTDITVVEVIPSPVADGTLTDNEPIFALGTGHTLINGVAANVLKVFGEVVINLPASIDGDWSGSPVSASTSANFYFEMHSVTMDQGIGVYAVGDAKVTLNGEYFVLGSSGYAISVRDTTDSVFNFQRIESSGSLGFFIRHGLTAGFSGTCRVEAEEITCSGSTQNLGFQNVLPGARIFIECTDCHQTGAGYAINNYNQTGGEIRIVGNITAPLGLVNNGTIGYLKIDGDFISTSDNTSFLSISSGNVYINGDIYHNSTPTAITQMINHTGGTLRLNGKIQNTTTGGYGIAKSGGTLVLDTVKIVSDSDSINAGVAQDIKVIHSLAVTSAVNANITNAIIGSNIITDAAIE